MNHLEDFLHSPPSRLLVISACTSKKKWSPADSLEASDLDDKMRRMTGESRLRQYRLPAAEMYTGGGHQYVRHAIGILRDHGYDVAHYILSAGYGWLNECDVIAPYDVTFAKKSTAWIRARGQQLGLRKQLIEIADEYQRMIFILGREYLEAIGLPLPIESLPPTLAYVAPSFAGRLGDGIDITRVGPAEQREIGAHWSSAKERQFLSDVHRVWQIEDNQ